MVKAVMSGAVSAMDARLQPMFGESKFDTHKRLVYGKLVDKTLSDVDYAELSECVYGQQYSSDGARKMMYGSAKTLQLMDMCQCEDPDEEYIKIAKERKALSAQKREICSLITAATQFDGIVDSLKGAVQDTNDKLPLVSFRRDSDACDTDVEAVLVLTDWHLGMVTDNPYQKFNSSICADRVSVLASEVAKRLSIHNPSVMHVLLLGDFCHGAISSSIRVESDKLVSDQLIAVSEMIAELINEVSSYVDSTYVYSTYGNHMRTVQRSKDSVHKDNMERVIPWWLESRFKDNDNVHIVNTDSISELVVFNVCDKFTICAAHGDLDKVKDAWSHLHTMMFKKHGYDIDYIILGDKHHTEALERCGIETIGVRSLCGVDNYAHKKRLYSEAGQSLIFFNSRCGKDATYDIVLR